MRRVRSTASRLEASFLMVWRALGGPKLTPEHRFDPVRKWRFDFAIPELLVAIEIEGGMWTNGRHTRGLGYAADCAKYNAATLAGWRVYRLTQTMVASPTTHVAPIVAAVSVDFSQGIFCRVQEQRVMRKADVSL